jgi:hypothetical protein
LVKLVYLWEVWNTREGQTSEVDHHGPGDAWGSPPLGVESNSKGSPPLGRFGKGEEEFLLVLGLPLGLEGREGVRVET